MMKRSVSRLLVLGLLALGATGSAMASQMKASSPVPAHQAPAFATTKAENPWPSLASSAALQQAPMLAHDDDRYWRDGRWHSRRDDWRREQWRKEQWRKEQHRREIERRRAAAYHHDHRYQDDHGHYRR